jgi:hypothetical protein
MARSKGTEGGPSMMGMVRSTLQELGNNAKPTAIQEHIKAKYDKDISKIIISNYKSTILKRRGSGKKRGRPPGSKAAVPAPAAIGAKGIRLEDLTAVRGLVGRLGASQVRQLVDVLA